MSIVPLRPEHLEALMSFFGELPAGDLTFIKENLTDPDTVRSWTRPEAVGWRWLEVEGGVVRGYLAVRRLPGWSDHVGEIRLVIDPAHRGAGLGRELARYGLMQSVEAGLSKLVVEIVSGQEAALRMFTELGFTGEALLRDQIRDRDGKLRDLLVLAHYVEQTWSAMTTLGLDDEIRPNP